MYPCAFKTDKPTLKKYENYTLFFEYVILLNPSMATTCTNILHCLQPLGFFLFFFCQQKTIIYFPIFLSMKIMGDADDNNDWCRAEQIVENMLKKSENYYVLMLTEFRSNYGNIMEFKIPKWKHTSESNNV